MSRATDPSEQRLIGWRGFVDAGAAPLPTPGRASSLFRSLAQQRLREFQRLLGGTHASLGVMGLVLSGFQLGEAGRLRIAALVHMGIGCALGLASWLLDRRKLDSNALAITDGITTVAASAVVVLSASVARLGVAGDVSVMVLTITLMLRVAIVPSLPRQTLAVGLASGIASVTSVRVVEAFDRAYARGGTTAEYVAFVIYALVIVLVTTKASKVIHGLHESVEAARRLGQYVLVEKVGEGGMGSVWKARHAMLKRTTAVKLMHGDRTSERDAVRFEREVQLTSRLSHPNTVAVFDYGRADDGRLYYAMEFVDGLSLEQLVDRQGPQPAARVIHLLRQTADALAEAHALGLIHRDVKPANVLVCERGGVADFVKVVDFGLVKALAPDPERTGKTAASDSNLLAGTPEYLAPETLLRPQEIDPRADLYALGVVGFYLLTGRPVFEGTNLVEICSHHLHTAPRAAGEVVAGVPPELDALVLRCLAKDPADRPASAVDVRRQLDALAHAHPWDLDRAAEGARRFL